ncbi:MAG: hypothetical protein ACR2RB_10370 [Gammaproteobacteria bacterium]
MIKTDPRKSSGCVPMPDFERLQYYYGRGLTVSDFQTEQQYFLDKLRLHNRCFHGAGIVCGLEVKPAPSEQDCDGHDDRQRRSIEQELRDLEARLKKLDAVGVDPTDAERIALECEQESLRRQLEQLSDCRDPKLSLPTEVWVNCGWAIDCHGRELVVRQPQVLKLCQLLTTEDRRRLEAVKEDPCAGPPVLELSICYCEQPTYPVRPVATDNCDVLEKCKYGRVREGYRFKLSLEHQPEDSRCGNCCEPCDYECVVLAHIKWPGEAPLTTADIDWTARRAISVYQPSVIDGISWQHGAVYDSTGAKSVLGTEESGGTRTDGIEVRFSKPVFAETLRSGVVEILNFKGGRGVAGMISHIEGSFVGLPSQGLVGGFKYRDESGETLNRGDRILIVVRTNFILDACCQPVDGEHVGGLVSQLADYIDKPEAISTPLQPPCAARLQPWTSGNGRPGSTFESWFFID